MNRRGLAYLEREKFMSLTQDSDETYVIEETSYKFEGKRGRSLAKSPNGRAVIFSSREAAQEHIDDYLDTSGRCLMHGEWRLSTFEIRAVGRLPQFLSWEL